MAKIALLGDLHIGKAFPHTTKYTNELFERLQDDALADFADLCDENNISLRMSLGDLFDSFSVTSSTFVRATSWALHMKLTAILGGNHDFSNDQTKMSALDGLKHLVDNGKLNMDVNIVTDSNQVVWFDSYMAIHMVPYMPTQELFVKSLEAAENAAKANPSLKHILLLHTNRKPVWSGVVTENNLDYSMAQRLLNSFEKIISGHEHSYASLMGDRFIMLGSLLPHSFGEMTDKYFGVLDTETLELSLVKSWSADKFQSIDVEDFVKTGVAHDVSFVEVTGQRTAEHIRAIASLTTNLLKPENNTGVIAVRNNTFSEEKVDPSGGIQIKKGSWLDKIRSSLEGDQLELFEKLYNEVSGD